VHTLQLESISFSLKIMTNHIQRTLLYRKEGKKYLEIFKKPFFVSSFRIYDKMINNNCVSISLKMVKVRASTVEKM